MHCEHKLREDLVPDAEPEINDKAQTQEQSEESKEWHRKDREYREKTDETIEQAEHFLDLYKQMMVRDYGSDEFLWPDSDVARLCELSCQVAKARGLRNGY